MRLVDKEANIALGSWAKRLKKRPGILNFDLCMIKAYH